MKSTASLYLHYRNKLMASSLFSGLSNQALDEMMGHFRYDTGGKRQNLRASK